MSPTWKIVLTIKYEQTYSGYDWRKDKPDDEIDEKGLTSITPDELYLFLTSNCNCCNKTRYLVFVEDIVDDQMQGYDKKDICIYRDQDNGDVCISYEYDIDFTDWGKKATPKPRQIEKIRATIESDLNDFPFTDTFHESSPGCYAIVPLPSDPDSERGVLEFSANVYYQK